MIDPALPKSRYKTTNWAQYNAALKKRGSLTIWLDKDMPWYAPASGQRGRQHTFTDAAIVFCLSIKCLFGFALRQSLGTVQSVVQLAGLDWRVPDFSTISCRQKTLQVQLLYQHSSTAAQRGICWWIAQASSFWVKMNGNAKNKRDAMAIMAPRKNAQVRKPSSAGVKVRNEAVRACQRLGWGIWKKCSGYHRRSLVETKMHCLKRLGERVMARTLERQVVQLHVRVALLNRFTQLGRPITVPVPAMA